MIFLRHPMVRSKLLGTIGLGLGGLSFVAVQGQSSARARLLLCDTPASFSASARHELSNYQRDAKAPLVKHGKINAAAVRQISVGSITGLVSGLLVSTFSKTLAFLIGLVIFGVQTLESRGIHVVPYRRLENLFKNTNVRNAVQNNVAFKISFGLTFALAAFAEL